MRLSLTVPEDRLAEALERIAARALDGEQREQPLAMPASPARDAP